MSDLTPLIVNGTAHTVDSPRDRPLLDVLREDLGLTGCKIGCGEGACGACTVLVDGQATRSCITPVGAALGHSVLTVEGLATHPQPPAPSSQPPVLHPLQQAFLDADAMQCGYCTPGMIMAALGLLEQVPDPSEDAIVAAMQGNICRCGTYTRIVRAIKQAALVLRAQAGGAQ
jgi:aerobic-type carbon monoxide dehydrogenase small subunit (CoxS/CutS family)